MMCIFSNLFKLCIKISVMNKTCFISIVIVLTATNIFAQLPPQTVVFKVRKKALPPEEIKIEERKDEVVQEDEPAFVIVEENATFQGGDVNTFRIWVQKNMVYPTAAAEAGIKGKVIVQFAVNSRGRVCDAKVLRGVQPILDKEAIRAIMSSPPWTPGKQGGKSIKQQFVIPIIFSLH
jgi:TonB family protein